LWRSDFHVHDRLQQSRLHFLHSVAKSLAAGGAEAVLVRVDVMIRTIDQLDFEIYQRIAGDRAVRSRLDDSFFDRRSKLLRHSATEDFVFKFKATAARQRFENHFAIAKLSAAAGLLLMTALHFGALRDRLFVRNFGRMQHYFDLITFL